MRFENLSYQNENRVMVIRLHDNKTDLSDPVQVANELNELCGVVNSDPRIQVVVVSLEQAAPPPEPVSGQMVGYPDPGYPNPLSWAAPVSKLEIPVIMSVNGFGVGQALELALACDIRMASLDSHFCLPHIHQGLIPWDGGTQRLARLIGKSNALEMILTGETINADQAHRMGLVNQIYEKEQVLPKAMETAQKIANKGPIALKYTKEVVRNGMELTLAQGLSLEADLYFLLHTSHDRTEGIKAFQEKRTPQFKGI